MLGSLPVLGHAINAFARTLHSTQIVVVLPEGQIDFWKNLAARFDIAKHTCTAGGLQRFHSVRNGLSALPRTVVLIAVHDGVRPLVSSDLILETVGVRRPTVLPFRSSKPSIPCGSSRPTDRTRSTAIRCESYKRLRSSTRNCSVVPMNSTTPRLHRRRLGRRTGGTCGHALPRRARQPENHDSGRSSDRRSNSFIQSIP